VEKSLENFVDGWTGWQSGLKSIVPSGYTGRGLIIEKFYRVIKCMKFLFYHIISLLMYFISKILFSNVTLCIGQTRADETRF
jgi:hypothetical protein